MSDYFSPNAPFAGPSSAPNLLALPATHTTHTTLPGGAVVTAIASTKPASLIAAHPAPHDVLQQFALQIPPPPPLSLASPALRTRTASAAPPAPAPPSFVPNPNQYHALASAPPPAPLPLQRAPLAPAPPMTLASTDVRHTLSVSLPRSIQPEMVTISANRGDRLRVAADAFGGDECHYEWQICFPPHDIDIAAVHARFHPDGRLTLDIKRRPRPMYY